MGASIFSGALSLRGIDFKYGGFTIFAPSDKLVSDSVLILEDDGHNTTTIEDIVLFHVSADSINEKITEPKHCGKSLLMLNQDLHVEQEKSITSCQGGKVYQIGPGNSGVVPQVVGEPIYACDSVIYMITDALMLPTLPVLPVAPTPVPVVTTAPPRQDPITETPVEEEPEPEPEPEVETTEEPDSGSNALSLAFTAFAGLVVAFL